MKLQGRIPVEPLDEERLTNIERRLVVSVSELRAPAPRLPRRLFALASVAMAIAVAGIVGYKLRGASPVIAPTAAPQVIAMTSDDAHSRIELGDVELTSTPGTTVRIERDTKRTYIALADGKPGRLDLHVEHDPSRLLVVRAGDTEIEDVGTRFTVDYDGKSHVEVRVTEGEVNVKRAAKIAAIVAGNAWTTEDGSIAITKLDERAAASATVAATSTTVAAVDTAPDGEPMLPGRKGATPGTSTQDAATLGTRDGATNGSNASAGSTNGSNASAGSAADSVARGRKPQSNARKALAKLPYEAPDDAGTEDPKAAIAVYLDRVKTAATVDDKAELLYSIAVMQHRAKDNEGAKHTIAGLLGRMGGTAKAYRAALWLNVRIECLEAFDDECRQAADLYQRKVPDGAAAGVAVAILKEITAH
ncbi:MAG: FecR domain-containing protein [Kofleriaceae bacterium]|nr:FecR domain-containing protein [Kofleriaceae bacterium]